MPKLRKISESEIGRIRTRRNGRWAYENPVMAGVREIITQPFYSSMAVAPNVAFPAQTTLFQVPVGQAGQTYLQTNSVRVPSRSNARVQTSLYRRISHVDNAEAIPFKGESVETIREASHREDDIVRPAWRHAESGRNDRSELFQ